MGEMSNQTEVIKVGSTITIRCRLLGRLRDAEGKWRDEFVQEASLEVNGFLNPTEALSALKPNLDAIEGVLMGNLAERGGALYEVKKEESKP